MKDFKNKAVIWVTAVTASFQSIVSFTYLDEPEIAGPELLITAALVAPLAITVAMIAFPQRFKEQLWRWFLGMCGNVALTAIFMFFTMMTAPDASLVKAVLGAMFFGIYVGIFGALLISSFAFLIGAFFNFFQAKPMPVEDIQKIFH